MENLAGISAASFETFVCSVVVIFPDDTRHFFHNLRPFAAYLGAHGSLHRLYNIPWHVDQVAWAARTIGEIHGSRSLIERHSASFVGVL